MNHWQAVVELTLKGMMILGAAGLLSVWLRNASAAVRHAVWSLALGALLLLPVMTYLVPAWRIAVLPAPPVPAPELNSFSAERSATFAEAVPLLPPNSVAIESQPESAPLSASAWTFSPLQIALLIWATGALLVMARLLLGMWRMWRITQDAYRLIDYQWSSLTNVLRGQLDIREHVALYASAEVGMPVTWGVFTPVVIMPPESLEWSAEWRRVVLLHELAHIKRRDCLTQMLANVVCALYWFNPLVWFAARRLRIERELACDDCVLEVGTRASDYASYLVELARSFAVIEPATPVTVGMACSQLESRVRAILDPQMNRRNLSRRRKAALALAMACALFPLAALQATSQASAQAEALTDTIGDSVTAAETTASAVRLATQQVKLAAMQEKAANRALTAAEQAELTRVQQTIVLLQDELRSPFPVTPAPAPIPNPLPAPRPWPAPAAEPAPEPVAVEQDDKQKGKDGDLTAENLIQLRMYNITPEYIEAIKRAGYTEVTIRQIAELKMHDITPDFIKQAQTMGGEKLSVRDLVQLKISGVNPEYIAAMRQAGYDNLSVRKLSQMRMVGVTPEFAAAMKRAGFETLTAEQLTSLKVHNVTEDYVKQVQGWGLGKLSMREVLDTKIHGVKPEDAQALKAMGFDNASLRDLTRVRMFGVTESYVKELRSLGLENLTLSQVIQLKQFGVDADYIRKMRAAGFKNISSNDLLKLKMQGLDAILLKN